MFGRASQTVVASTMSLQYAGTPFPVAQINHIRTVRTGAVKDIVPFQDKRFLTVTVI